MRVPVTSVPTTLVTTPFCRLDVTSGVDTPVVLLLGVGLLLVVFRQESGDER